MGRGLQEAVIETVKPERGGFAPAIPQYRGVYMLVQTRRTHCLQLASLLGGAAAAQAASGAETAPGEWAPGPHLLLDRELSAGGEGLERTVTPPARLPEPVVTGYEDGNFQPYLTVVRDPESRLFRIWYGTPRTPQNPSESSIATMQSEDGIHWRRPHRVLRDPAPINFGCSVIDEGPGFSIPAARYRLAWWHGGGSRIAVSPDGLEWSPLSPEPLIRHNHDITSIHPDPIRKRYLALVSVVAESGPYRGLRMPHQSVSSDLLHWSPPRRIITPDPAAAIEKGETQFYCMSGVIARGSLLIGLVKVLRDDLNCEPDRTAADLRDPGRPYAGIGYTVLAWSRDGENWERETQPFLNRNSQPGTWDRAMAWGDCQIMVGDRTYIYYGGYRWGHKAERFTGRQIGLADMPADRYIAYSAGPERGTFRTALRRVGAAVQLTANADVDPGSGELLVRMLDPAGTPYPGFDWSDCRPVRGDRIDHPIAWKGRNATLQGRSAALEFRLQNARLWSFNLR